METDVRIVIDRPNGTTAVLGGGDRVLEERVGSPISPIWMLSDIQLASGRMLIGGIRLTPPQGGMFDPQVVRATGILAYVSGRSIDLLVARERRMVGIVASEAIPLRIRFHEDAPIDLPGFDLAGPAVPLRRGVWSRPLVPIDLALDVTRLAPLAW